MWEGRLAAPGRDSKDAMLLAEVARGGCDDGAFGENQLSPRLNRRPHIVLANEVERRITLGV